MATTVQDLIDQMLTYQYNPAAMQRAVLQTLTDVTNGNISVVDPTNPFVFCLESAAVLTAAWMSKAETCTRIQYPSLSQTPEDLYYHMSDIDYADRFAVPATTTFSLLLSKDEVLNNLVLDPSTGISKIVIPRNSYFTVADTNFSIQYPIEIRQMQHGGLQVVYDASEVSPLQTLTTNLIDYEIRSNQDGDWIFFQFEAFQFDIISQQGAVNMATDFVLTIPFSDQYYYTRVYMQATNGAGWTEIQTTHSAEVYDPTVPTAVLQVVDQVITVRIPQVYTNNGLIAGNIRADVYETKGPLNMLMQNYPLSAYTATWQAYDPTDLTIFTAPLSTMRQIIPYSDQVVSGGRDALSYADLRSRVMNNSMGEQSLPITNVQLQNAMTDQGYEIIKNIDVVTNRVFLATKPMPQPTNANLLTAASASIETLSASLNDLIALSSVVNNQTSVTITPDTLYQADNGIATLVSSEEIQHLLALTPVQRALAVTSGNYLYSPFHYVLDMTNNEFNIRPYYLDSPSLVTKTFVSENDSTLLQVATGSYQITRTATGYMIQIVTQSSAAYQALNDSQVYVQLAYIPEGEQARAYLNGVLMGRSSSNERIYQFDLSTTYNVDSNNCLELTKFMLYTTDPRITKTPLLNDFDLIYSTTAAVGAQWQAGEVDTVVGRTLVPANTVGITHEKLRVQFGETLDTLWARARTVISSAQYKVWPNDVPRFYTDDVYAIDPTTGSSFTIDSNGNIQYNILHHKGDPVLDSSGNPVYQYRAGDVMLDNTGQPIIANPRGLLRQMDLFLIEGVYWFATDPIAVNYRSTLTATVVDWLTNQLEAMNGELLEQTRLYFYPKTTLGSVTVMIRNGVTTVIPAAQSFVVTLYVDSAVYNNTLLRSKLETTTIQTLAASLDTTVISMSQIQAALVALYGTDVIDVQLSGLGGTQNLPALTLVNSGDRLGIRKKLVAMSDNTLSIQEDVTFQYIEHQMSN